MAESAKPVLLSGGNPQIAKGDGDAPVQAYIAAMPGWKSALWARLDETMQAAIIKKAKPNTAYTFFIGVFFKLLQRRKHEQVWLFSIFTI